MCVAMYFLSIPLPLVAISLAVTLAIFVIIRSQSRRFGDYQKKKRYHPIVGTLFSTLINFSTLHDYITENAYKQRTFRFLYLFINYVVTIDPANVEYILKTNFPNYGKGLYQHRILSDMLGDGVFVVDGEIWRHQRTVSSYEISTKVVRDLGCLVFKTNAVKLSGIISEAATCCQAIEIQDLFMKTALDSIVKVLFGIELDTMHGTNEESIQFSKAFDLANEMTMYRYLDFSWKFKWFLNIESEAVLRKNLKVVDQFINNLIKRKIDAVCNSSEDELLSLKKGDIVTMLLESNVTDTKYLRDMILCITVAGKDTTALTLSWFMYMLCKHPHIQEKIAEEIQEVANLKENSSIDELADSLTEEALDKMQYLHAALSETLRLYPTLPVNAKICLSDDTWPDGYSVQKGDLVAYSSYSMGRMKFIWGDDAEEFRPERWLDKNGLFQQESSFRFTSFGGGPRICLGKDFAYRETKIISAVLVGSFIFKLTDEKKEAKYKTNIVLHIDGGLYVQAYPRSGLARP